MRAPLSRPCTIWLCNLSSPSCRAGITPFPSHVPLPFLNETQALCWHRASQGVAAGPLHSLKVTRSPALLGRDACLLWAHSKGFLGPTAWPLPGCHFLSHAHRGDTLAVTAKEIQRPQAEYPTQGEGRDWQSLQGRGSDGERSHSLEGKEGTGVSHHSPKIMVMPHSAWGSSGHPQPRVHMGRTEMVPAPQLSRAWQGR